MIYPVYVFLGDKGTAHSVHFPDFPGCHAAADSLDDLPAAINEAVQAHFFGEADAVPPPTNLASLKKNRLFTGGAWVLADIDLAAIPSAKPIRINVSLPENVLSRIDTHVAENHLTRSGFLAKAATEFLEMKRAA